jgi:hypothetical protein
VPDRGQEHRAVDAVRGEHGDERTLEQVAELVGPEVLAHLKHRRECGVSVTEHRLAMGDEHALDRELEHGPERCPQVVVRLLPEPARGQSRNGEPSSTSPTATAPCSGSQ